MVHCVYRDNLNRITGEIHGSITIKYYINGKKLSEYNAETKVKQKWNKRNNRTVTREEVVENQTYIYRDLYFHDALIE